MQETVRGTVEPLALLRGMDREATGVRAAFAALVSHTRRVLSAQFAAGVTSDFLLKYSAATAAVIMIIGPFFGATTTTMAARARMLSDMRYHTRRATPSAPHPQVTEPMMASRCRLLHTCAAL